VRSTAAKQSDLPAVDESKRLAKAEIERIWRLVVMAAEGN
jgi:hypothetical protein